MNLEQLRGFVEVASLGNFTRAAANLHLAQPSLSRQISALEGDLGAPLFDRARGGSTLTAAGESLLPLARRMLADAESVRRELAELAGLRRGRVRLGATPTLCISLVAEVLSAFHAAHPAIELHLSEHGSRQLLDELAAGELDLALITTSDARAAEEFSVAPLLVEELVVISSGALPAVAAGPSITLPEVAALPQIVFSASYDLRGATDEAFRAAGLSPEVVLEGAEMDAVLRFVERGLGVAIVPAMVLIDRPGLRSVRLTADAPAGAPVPVPGSAPVPVRLTADAPAGGSAPAPVPGSGRLAADAPAAVADASLAPVPGSVRLTADAPAAVADASLASGSERPPGGGPATGPTPVPERPVAPALSRTISLARPAGVAPAAAVEVMQRTIAATATAFAARAGATMRLAPA